MAVSLQAETCLLHSVPISWATVCLSTKDSCFFIAIIYWTFTLEKWCQGRQKYKFDQKTEMTYWFFLHAAHQFLCDSICIYLRDCQNLPTKYFMFLSRASARWSSLSGHEVWQNAEYLTWVTVSLADFYLTITLSSILLWRLGSWQ